MCPVIKLSETIVRPSRSDRGTCIYSYVQYIYVCMYVCRYVCIYECMYVCMYIAMYRNLEKFTIGYFCVKIVRGKVFLSLGVFDEKIFSNKLFLRSNILFRCSQT